MNEYQLYLYNLEIANREHTKWLEPEDDDTEQEDCDEDNE